MEQSKNILPSGAKCGALEPIRAPRIRRARKQGDATVRTVCIVRAPAEIQSRQRLRDYALRMVASKADASSTPIVRTKPLKNNEENGADGADAKIPSQSAPGRPEAYG